MMKIRRYIPHLIILAVTVPAGILASIEFLGMHKPEPLYPSEHLTRTTMLSDYFPGIRNTGADTEVFIFDSGEPGGTALVCGGTHPNEFAAYLASVMILENLRVTRGRVFVIPRLNKSAFTCTDPMEGFPQYAPIRTPGGTRTFRLGSRVTNPLDQWPDPLVFSHFPSGQKLSGFETRNINRAYPGKKDGNLTERLGYAVLELIRREEVDISIDLHESSPEVPIVNVIVYHEKDEMTAMGAVLGLEMQGQNYSPELSPRNFHGLSHREWGDHTGTSPFLLETSNPSQGRIREATTVDLVLNGKSKFYERAKKTNALRIVYDEQRGEPVDHRVARHVIGVKELIFSHNLIHEDRAIGMDHIPDYDQIMEYGTGYYLQIPGKGKGANKPHSQLIYTYKNR